MGKKIGLMLEAYNEGGDIKPLRETIDGVYGTGPKGESMENYDDSSVVRLAEQAPVVFPLPLRFSMVRWKLTST